MVSDITYKKMLWHSRRGMWELDILLLPFAEKKLPELDDTDHKRYERLLTEEDQDLFSCLVERVQHPDKEMQIIIAKIREFAVSGVARPH
jgi:antitoxin CptB